MDCYTAFGANRRKRNNGKKSNTDPSDLARRRNTHEANSGPEYNSRCPISRWIRIVFIVFDV